MKPKTKRYKWTAHRKNIRTLLQAGDTVESVLNLMERSRKKAAAAGGWRPSELAAAMAHDRGEIIEVARRCKIDASAIDRHAKKGGQQC